MTFSAFIKTARFSALAVLLAAPLHAGGLCGSDGFFRGSVGKFCDDVGATEIVQQGTVRGAEAGVTALLAPTGLPEAVTGRIGREFGHAINERFAGRGGFEAANPGGRPPGTSGPRHGDVWAPQPPAWQPPPMGNFCMTPMGPMGPGVPMPIGSPCHTMTAFGPLFGTIGRI